MKKKHMVYMVMLMCVLMIVSACGSTKKEASAPDLAETLEDQKTPASVQTAAETTPEAAVQNAAETTPEAAVQNAAETTPEAAVQPASETAAETAAQNTAAVTETPAQEAPGNGSAAGAPVITENPTDESLTEGYSCMYIAEADNADSMEWRAVSPDGNTDIPYSEISSYFPYLDYTGEKGDALSLFNIPADFDGWGSYCRFKNSAGSTDSGVAVTHVTSLKTVEAENREKEQREADSTDNNQ